ncbi:MAG: uL30 family ribosomal protein, partial [Nanoarchaeota archaeon]
MICIIRIKGEIGLNRDVVETLSRLRIRKKYSCVVIKEDAEKLGMIKRVKDSVAYGNISDETFEKLIEKRGQLIDKKKKIDAKKIVSHL